MVICYKDPRKSIQSTSSNFHSFPKGKPLLFQGQNSTHIVWVLSYELKFFNWTLN